MNRSFSKLRAAALTLAAVISVSACGDGNSSATSITNGAFPEDLAVASPLSMTATTAGSASLSRFAMGSSSYTSTFSASAEEIAVILSSSSSATCKFNPEDFLETETDAECYGPAIDYQDHPDGGGTEDGELPPHDVGIWNDTEDGSTTACGAAEVNARMNGITIRTKVALESLASMVCALTINHQSLPVNDTVDLLDEMKGLGVTDTTFTTASLTHSDSTGTDVYTYALDFTFTTTDTYDVSMEMEHTADPAGDFHGRMSYLVNTSMTGGNCPDPEVTSNNSILYSKTAADGIAVEVRSAQFCGHNSDGRVDGIVDPSQGYVAATNSDGWGNNFSIFTANFDSTTMEGDFSYAWQAGPNDDNSRIFNLHVEPNPDDTDPSGEDSADIDMYSKTYFGFGDTIDQTDGQIQGFICNWFGPGYDHTLTESAQYQFITADFSSGEIDAAISLIDYAPTNSCSYDGSSTFKFDSDSDNDLSDENSALAITEELLDPTDGSDADSDATIEETLDAAGFTLPTPPSNL